MGERPTGMQLEREDNNKGYGPDNCVWASSSTQSRNTRRNIYAEISGRKYVLKDLAAALALSDGALTFRVYRRGMTLEQAARHAVLRRLSKRAA